MTYAAPALAREIAHTRRREARPGYAPTRTPRVGWALLAPEGWLSAAAVELLMAPKGREGECNERVAAD